MSFTPFTLASGTTCYLDPKGQIKVVLLGSRTATISDFNDLQSIAEAMLGCAPANFVLNQSALLYDVGDHDIQYGPGAVPMDWGSASPSQSHSASPSAS